MDWSKGSPRSCANVRGGRRRAAESPARTGPIAGSLVPVPIRGGGGRGGEAPAPLSGIVADTQNNNNTFIVSAPVGFARTPGSPLPLARRDEALESIRSGGATTRRPALKTIGQHAAAPLRQVAGAGRGGRRTSGPSSYVSNYNQRQSSGVGKSPNPITATGNKNNVTSSLPTPAPEVKSPLPQPEPIEETQVSAKASSANRKSPKASTSTITTIRSYEHASDPYDDVDFNWSMRIDVVESSSCNTVAGPPPVDIRRLPSPNPTEGETSVPEDDEEEEEAPEGSDSLNEMSDGFSELKNEDDGMRGIDQESSLYLRSSTTVGAAGSSRGMSEFSLVSLDVAAELDRPRSVQDATIEDEQDNVPPPPPRPRLRKSNPALLPAKNCSRHQQSIEEALEVLSEFERTQQDQPVRSNARFQYGDNAQAQLARNDANHSTRTQAPEEEAAGPVVNPETSSDTEAEEEEEEELFFRPSLFDVNRNVEAAEAEIRKMKWLYRVAWVGCALAFVGAMVLLYKYYYGSSDEEVPLPPVEENKGWIARLYG